MNPPIHHGRCGCGAVSFTLSGALPAVGYCHCSQCRRQTGLYYASVTVDKGALVWDGLEQASIYRSSETAERGFCRRCGSALFWREDGAGEVSIMAGLLDMPSGLQGGYHIHCDDKGDFYPIADGLPQFARGRS
ncbi:GFA family protein [Ensifer soli]|uniref:GFA family protein n=1 Tax=Ciceribacter sp. sgz301302 TaxID=3342379 RepID=UPI0035B9CF65